MAGRAIWCSKDLVKKQHPRKPQFTTISHQYWELQALDNVGPNTFACVQTIIEAVKLKFKNQLLELHVFFNDHVANDFNTLFKAFLIDRTYMVARVPGSFHGQLFPKASMNLMHTAFCLHWLSRVPEQVTKVGSCAWNKGRISYVSSSDEVVQAFGAQFESDTDSFFAARSAELVDDTFECLGCALADKAKAVNLKQSICLVLNFPLNHIPKMWHQL